MRRFPIVAARISVAGAVALIAGSMMIVGVTVQALTAPAFADTSAFELFCTNTPIGNLVFNDVVMTGSLSPAAPSPGQQFSLANFQSQVTVPADIVQEATAVGNTSIAGTASATIVATGATPSSLSTGSLAYAQTIPNPVPASGVVLNAPSTPATIGPFTATSSNISLSLGSSITITFNDIAIPGALPPLNCSAYPNDVMSSGLAQAIPPGLPISPVIAAAGSVPTPTTVPAGAVTGPYELYCPHTPVGDLVFNDVTTSATISPGTLSAGNQFQVSGYQTDIPIPVGAVTAAVGLGNGSFDGLAASSVDAYGATPSQVPTGSMGFDVPIPNPVPSSGLALDIPSSPTTVGPFTATGGPVTIAQDQSVLVVAKLSSKAFKMSCTAFPNDSIATSGSTSTPPAATPIRPIIATTNASGTPITTTTTTIKPGGPGTGNQTPGAPYELYCPGTPVGDIAVNDVVTTGSIAPTSLNEGDQFQVTNLQTQFTIPQSVAQQAENLGLTTLSGDLSLYLDVTGTEYNGFPGTVVGVGSGTTSVTTSTSSSSSSSPSTSSPTPTTTVVYPGPVPGPYPYPYPFPGVDDMSFNVTLPSPVPSTGVQFTATPAPGSQPETFTAAGGPIQVFTSGANLNVSAFGDQFGLFCDTLANNTVPTGLSIQEPFNGLIEPLITTGSATTIPPPPAPPGAPGAYELYCPGTPVGNIVLNNVDTSGTITPSDPSPGEQFNLTGYQTTLTIPSSIASAAAALGNSAITGSATGSVDATGATPAQISTGAMSINAPIPSPVPVSGVTLTLPSPAGTIGPFTASSGAITIAEDASVQLVLIVSGSDLTLRCSAYANNTEPSGIVSSFPPGSPMSPVIATTSSGVPPTTVPTTTPTTPTTIPPGGFTGPYELYCPGTPVGNIVLNDVTTTGSIPAALSSGQGFSLSSFQTQVTLPSSIASAAQALGNTAIAGTAVVKVDATGATPASLSAGDIAINAPLPSPIPSTGITLNLPSTPGTVGPFTATGGAITLTVDPAIDLTLNVSGSNLSLVCKPYPNDSAPTGIASSAPVSSPISPVIATGSTTAGSTTAGSTPTTATTATSSTPTTIIGTATDPTTTSAVSPGDPSSTIAVSTTTIQGSTTTDPPAVSTTVAAATKANAGSSSSSTSDPITVASSGSLAFTGPGAATGWIVVAGAALIMLGLAMLVLADAPRRLRWALAGRWNDVGVRPLGADPRSGASRRNGSPEALWVKDAGDQGGPKQKR